MELEDLANLLGSPTLLSGGEPVWSLTAAVDKPPRFAAFDKAQDAKLVKEWPHGRVFCAAWEIRWQYLSGQTKADVITLTENESVDSHLRNSGFKPVGQGWEAVQPGKAALIPWGSHAPGKPANVRAETRIPHPLEYPEGCEKAETDYSYYRDSASGATRFVRLRSVR